MIAIRLVTAAAVALVLSGCGMVSFEDVSSEPTYKPLIGRQLQAPSELMLFGVTRDRNYAKRVDICVLTPRPGFDGPEVVTRAVLPAGTTFTVLSVQRCTNCLFGERVELLVSARTEASCGQVPIKIDNGHLGSTVRMVPLAHGGAPNNSFKPSPLRGLVQVL